MRILFRGAVALLMLMTAAWSFSEFFPGVTSKMIIMVVRASEGLEAKTVKTEFGDVHYLEGGQGPVIVFVHGMYGSKDNWLRIVRYLKDSYRVIIVDVPGYGDNSVLSIGGYGLEQQVKRLSSIINALKLGQFHLAGNALGAQLAAMISVRNPDNVSSLAFIGGAVGVRYALPGEPEKVLTEVKSYLLVQKRQDFHRRVNILFPAGKPKLYRPILRAEEEKAVSSLRLNIRIWKETVDSIGKVSPLIDLAPMISQRALVLWCVEDKVYDIAGAELLAGALSRGVLVKLSGCGTVPMIDKPEETGRALRRFLDSSDNG
ncbi:MAG: alpha/beta fold hydrolase [Methyloligellaceae bacterium]